MLNKRFLFVALILVAWTAVAPAMASARPLRGERLSQWQTVVWAVDLWWGFITRGVIEPRTAQTVKNGCGIDPNGQPLCEPFGGGGMGGSGLQSGTEGDPADSGN
jgi:hypothetical protein